jgi:hypothetical protein
VRIPFRWRVGSTYRLSVAAAGDAVWEARVAEVGGPDHLIGRIQVAPGWGRLRDASVMWTERYAGPLSSCADIGYASALFSTPTADGGTVAPVSHRNYLGPPPGCRGSAVADVADGVVHVMGERGRPPDG